MLRYLFAIVAEKRIFVKILAFVAMRKNGVQDVLIEVFVIEIKMVV